MTIHTDKIFNNLRPNSQFVLNPVSVSSVMSALKAIDPKKATGVDDLDPLFLRMAASLITEPLTHIFNLSITTGVVPGLWKAAHVTPLHKGVIRLTLIIIAKYLNCPV